MCQVSAKKERKIFEDVTECMAVSFSRRVRSKKKREEVKRALRYILGEFLHEFPQEICVAEIVV